MNTGYIITTDARFIDVVGPQILITQGDSLNLTITIRNLDEAIALRRKLDAAILDMKAAVEHKEAQERKRKWGTE